LDGSLLSSNKGIDRARAAIALLREFRTRLTADVVTGKLDVREAAARLPDGAQEPKPFDEAEALAEGDGEDADVDAASEEADP
jgi:type I restriction enzyme S subunit